MSNAQFIKEQLAEENTEALLADGFDEALIGILRRFGTPPVACYSYEKCIAILMEDGMSYEDAMEYFEFNTIGAWVGEGTPAFVEAGFQQITLTDEEDEV
jgi:hypothetical protein